MPNYYSLEPEVAGGIGEGTVWTTNADGRRIVEEPLRFEFAGWLGDDIVETAGYWVITQRLADALRASDLTGYELRPVVLSFTPEWDMMPLPAEFPAEWERMVPTGNVENGDDIAVERNVYLTVSQKALDLLQTFNLNEAEISEGSEPVVPEYMQRFLEGSDQGE